MSQASSTVSPLISIVTPAYNEEQHLSECIESVLAQTYRNWEHVIVNNCSTDKTLSIASAYAAKDSRIRVYDEREFVPAVTNFNRALRYISSESKYCKMVLADDWIFPECLERMADIMEQYPSVGIVGAYGLVNRLVFWTGLPYPSPCSSGREICRERLLGGPYLFGSPTSLMFRADLVRDERSFFNESNIHADSEVCFRLLGSSDFGFVHQVLTFSRDYRSGSILEASRELNTAAAAFLHELTVYGPRYLTQVEYAAVSKDFLSKYYDLLASRFLQGRPRSFWAYHREKLRGDGIELSYARLAYAVVRRILYRFRPPHMARPRTPLDKEA